MIEEGRGNKENANYRYLQYVYSLCTVDQKLKIFIKITIFADFFLKVYICICIYLFTHIYTIDICIYAYIYYK